MLKKLILIIVAIAAFVGGAVGGEVLRERMGGSHDPANPPSTTAEGGDNASPKTEIKVQGETQGDDWFRFEKQFFVPIVRNGTTTSVMVMTLTLEMSADARPEIEAREFRLRDALLNALMIEANTGGFDGNFTSDAAMTRLRASLLKAARNAAGPKVARVLIEDIARQDQ